MANLAVSQTAQHGVFPRAAQHAVQRRVHALSSYRLHKEKTPPCCHSGVPVLNRQLTSVSQAIRKCGSSADEFVGRCMQNQKN